MSVVSAADRDTEARNALWRAILVAADTVQGSLAVGPIRNLDGSAIRTTAVVPDLPTWRLVEALCLLGILLRSEDAHGVGIELFRQTGPVRIVEDGAEGYLWTQPTLHGMTTSLKGRPDLVVTSSLDHPSPDNAVRIIESKCIRKLGAQTVRSEYGKAHDLRVATYLIWSFYTPSEEVVRGASKLGIDLEGIGFDSTWRQSLISDPRALVSRVANTQEQARKAQRFAVTLYQSAQTAVEKFGLVPRQQ